MLVALGSVFFVTRALGGPSPALFQLDGNAVTDPSPAVGADDWDKVFGGTSASFSHVFIPYATESPATDATAWEPGTKATDDISQWGWQTNTSVINAKADITNAYAAAYKDGTNTVMYFGLDRFDESGDANVGFWFLQDPNFKLNADGTFSGQHIDGDVFIQSQFLNGGGVAVPVEYIWQGGALVQQSTAGAICTTSVQPLCAIDNDGVSGRPGTITVPWTYQDKDGNPAGTITPNGFFEGGFNLNSAFGNGDLPCFTHFIAQTGTSGASGNSETLKDLAAGDVQSCGTLQLKKHWIGTAGTVDLNIGTTGTGAGAADITTQHVVGADGQTSEVERKVGTYYVSESLTNAGSYITTLACFNDVNHNGTQDQYFDMVRAYAAYHKLDMPDADLIADALEWSMTRGGRSGRVAWQYIQDLAGRLGKELRED